MTNFSRSLDELKKHAILYWSDEIVEKAAAVSVLPLLLKTQDKFLSLLKLADEGPTKWKDVLLAIPNGELYPNLFVKHLMVLSDLGGEALNKYPPITRFFPQGRMAYIWNEREFAYDFKVIKTSTSLANPGLKVDGKKLFKRYALDAKMEDVSMLLLHAGSAVNDSLPKEFKEKCMIGTLIGQPDALDEFVKQSYIRISRQIGGATANAMGHFAQNFVHDELKTRLPHFKFKKDAGLPNVRHTDDEDSLTTFDVVAISPDGEHFGIEVSFQVTTNAYIERKAGQAKERMERVHAAGHKLCYVLDGAGNINVREHAARIICEYSDCTVALSSTEMDVLAEFISAKR